MTITWRSLAALLAISFVFTACGGGGGGTSFLGSGSNGSGSSGGTTPTGGSRTIAVTVTIPAAAGASSSSRGNSIVSAASSVRKPQTISAGTQSITVSVNGGPIQIFNVSACTGSPNLTCVLNVGASYGLDSFLIITWSGPNGTGTALNAAAVTLNVSASGPNTASATAGNLITVNNNGDGSGGSNSCTTVANTCTLREAIAEASTTAGVYTAIMFNGVTSITVGSPITINGQSLIILGPGALSANTNSVGAPSSAANLTISGGGASQIFYVNSGSSLLVDGVTLSSGNSSDSYGGAIENYGSLAVVNTILSGNAGANTQYGGAIYDAGSVPSTISLSTFNNNAAKYEGGAYYDDAGASFSGTLFNGNVAFSGSGFTSGGAIYADWNLSVDKSTFTANAAGSSTGTGISAEGGAISIVGASVNPSITNSTFGGSTASAGNFAGGNGTNDDGYGGALYNGGPSSLPLTFSGNTFSNNIVKGGDEAQGGAIWDDRGITSNGDTFTNNVADGTPATTSSDAYAGAVYEDESPTSWTGDTFSGNQALGGTNVTYAEAAGGAIYAYSQLTATQTTFSNNSAVASDYVDAAAVYVEDDSTDTIAFSNVQFTNNTATATLPSSPSDYPEADAGALEVDYAGISMQNVTFSGNTASATGNSSFPGSAFGGGFLFYDGDSDGGCDDDCGVARNPSPQVAHHNALPAAARRAAVATRKAAIKASQKTRRASAFARIKAAATTRVAKKSRAATTVARHVAATRKVQSGPANGLDTVTFTNNTANGGPAGQAYGGGAEFSGDPTTSAVTFTGNIAEASGTGSYAAGGAFTYGDESNCETITFTGTVTGNSATNAGGGIWNNCGTLIVQSSTISGNSVTAVAFTNGDGGGGLWNYEDLQIIQSTVNGNTVAGSVAGTGGGGLLNYEGYAVILDSTFFGNRSSVDGGGVENIDYSETDVIGSTMYQNTATGNGGNISNDPSNAGLGTTYIYLGGSILAGGTAASGSDVWNLDNVFSYGYNVVQQSATFGTGTANVPQTGDLIGSNPLLASGLANNGGPTQTIADTSSSPGKGHIPFSSGECGNLSGTNVDQRGYARGTGNVCDAGAYEFNGVPGNGTPIETIAIKRKAR